MDSEDANDKITPKSLPQTVCVWSEYSPGEDVERQRPVILLSMLESAFLCMEESVGGWDIPFPLSLAIEINQLPDEVGEDGEIKMKLEAVVRNRE
jgi:hypothetical protein